MICATRGTQSVLYPCVGPSVSARGAGAVRGRLPLRHGVRRLPRLQESPDHIHAISYVYRLQELPDCQSMPLDFVCRKNIARTYRHSMCIYDMDVSVHAHVACAYMPSFHACRDRDTQRQRDREAERQRDRETRTHACLHVGTQQCGNDGSVSEEPQALRNRARACPGQGLSIGHVTSDYNSIPSHCIT